LPFRIFILLVKAAT
jgi:hypothetical protein